MFLTSDNKLMITRLKWGGVVTFVLIVLGIAWFDKPLYMFLRHLDSSVWKIFDYIFDVKFWLVLTGLLLMVVLIKKTVNSGINYKNIKKQFSFVTLVKDLVSKVRTNYAFLIFSSVLSTGIIVNIFKVLIGRFRPIFFEALGITGFRPFSFEWAFNSMPSGHAAATFAGLIMVGMLAPKYKPLTWTLAIIVGVSRVCMGTHWPSDVIFGAFIGMVMADLIKYWAFKRK